MKKLSRLINTIHEQRAQNISSRETLRRLKQKGFTLIELMVVLLIIGIIAALAYPALMGSTDTSRAQVLYDTADKMASNWQLMNQSCGTSKAVTSNITTGGAAADALNLLFRGTGAAASMTACYANSGVRPMVEMAKGGAGTYTVQDYAVAVAGGGSISTPLTITYTGVPTSIALVLYQKYSNAAGASTATALPAAADTTDPTIRFSAPASGLTNLTIVRII